MDEISNIYMDELDFVRICSCLLENAYEAAWDSEEKFLTIALFHHKKALHCMIKNSCYSESNINIHALFKQGTSSKGKQRGQGLYNVLHILNNYNHVSLETDYSKNIFTQHLIIKTTEKWRDSS